MRAETGVMAFGDDWPGLFLRGDVAMGYAMAVEQAYKSLRERGLSEMSLLAIQLRDLASDLRMCAIGEHDEDEVQRAKSWEECVVADV